MRFPAINVGPPLTPGMLTAYCAEHDLVIPEPLRLQLLDQNGGAPEDDVIISVDGRDEELMSFFGVGVRDRASELAWMAKTFEGRLPEGLLPFACDPGGNLFVVETDARRGHPVWFWDHELEGDSTALSPVAATLEEFLSTLRDHFAELEP